MAKYVLTVVVEASDPDFSKALEDSIAALQADGFTPIEVRVASDQGETVVPVPEPEEAEPPAGTTKPGEEPPGPEVDPESTTTEETP